MERIVNRTATAAANIVNAGMYALGHFMATAAFEVLRTVDVAIGGVEWGDDDE